MVLFSSVLCSFLEIWFSLRLIATSVQHYWRSISCCSGLFVLTPVPLVNRDGYQSYIMGKSSYMHLESSCPVTSQRQPSGNGRHEFSPQSSPRSSPEPTVQVPQQNCYRIKYSNRGQDHQASVVWWCSRSAKPHLLLIVYFHVDPGLFPTFICPRNKKLNWYGLTAWRDVHNYTSSTDP